MTAKAR